MTNDLRVPFDDLIGEVDRSVSYRGKPFTGIAYETNSAGIVVGEERYENGFQIGIAREWYDSGRLRSESDCVGGSKHGTTKCWHENGQLESEAEYSHAIKTSERVWDSQGKLLKDWTLPEDHWQRALLEKFRKLYGY